MGSHQQRDGWKLVPSSAWVGPERQYILSRLWSHLSEALVQLLKFLHLQWPATWVCWSLLIKEPLTQAPGSVVIVGAVPGLLDVPWVTITVYEILWICIAPSLLEQHCCFPCPLELKLAEDALPLVLLCPQPAAVTHPQLARLLSHRFAHSHLCSDC